MMDDRIQEAFLAFGQSGQGIGNAESDRIAFRAGAAAALRAAADAWASGEWHAVNFNKAKRDEPPHARQSRWLRDRADEIEAS